MLVTVNGSESLNGTENAAGMLESRLDTSPGPSTRSVALKADQWHLVVAVVLVEIRC